MLKGYVHQGRWSRNHQKPQETCTGTCSFATPDRRKDRLRNCSCCSPPRPPANYFCARAPLQHNAVATQRGFVPCRQLGDIIADLETMTRVVARRAATGDAPCLVLLDPKNASLKMGVAVRSLCGPRHELARCKVSGRSCLIWWHDIREPIVLEGLLRYFRS